MAETTQHPVIYCSDGSEHARNALTTASQTLGERHAVVVSVWRSAWTAIAAVPYAIPPQETVDEVDGAAADAVLALAREGAAVIPGATFTACAPRPPSGRPSSSSRRGR